MVAVCKRKRPTHYVDVCLHAIQTVANGASFSSKEAFMCGLDPFVAASRVCHASLQRSLASLQRSLASLQRSLASSRTT